MLELEFVRQSEPTLEGVLNETELVALPTDFHFLMNPSHQDPPVGAFFKRVFALAHNGCEPEHSPAAEQSSPV